MLFYTATSDDIAITSTIEHAAQRIGLEMTHHVIVTPDGAIG